MMHIGTISMVSRISGRDMPSMPTRYLLEITSIHGLSTTNCSWPVWPRSNQMSSSTPTNATHNEVTSAISLCRSSRSLGMSIMTATPASGEKVASVMPQPSSRFSMSASPRR